MMNSPQWYLCLACLIAVFLIRLRLAGPRAAVGTISLCCLLVPMWLLLEVAGQPLNVRVVMMLVALGLYDIHPQPAFRTTLVAADFARLSLIAVQILSD